MVGGYIKSYIIILLGRFIFGLGGESLCVSQSAIVSIWFKEKQLAIALETNMTFIRFASIINGFISPILINNYGIGITFLTGDILCIFSFIMAIILVIIDKYTEDKYSQDREI